MSVILKTRSTDVLGSIFIFYDFKQVRDTIMIVAFCEKFNQWEKLFVFNIDGAWKVEMLRQYLEEKRFDWVCSKLNLIFQNREVSSQFDGIDIDKEMKDEKEFITALNAI